MAPFRSQVKSLLFKTVFAVGQTMKKTALIFVAIYPFCDSQLSLTLSLCP